jgi:glycosyltransferase involved in cell wall biosynthesis
LRKLKILFIVDGALDRPILHSQGIPHLKRLSKLGYVCFILSFEKDPEILHGELAKELASSGITWCPVYGSEARGNMILRGFWLAWNLCRKEKIDVIHCRSYRPSVIGSALKLICHSGFIFDMRGFLIDEQVFLDRWKIGSLKYRFSRWIERWILLNADEIVTNTTRFRDQVVGIPYFPREERADQVLIIQNCVDTQRFLFDPVKRVSTRQEFGWDDKFVLVFTGEARKWESFEQIINLFITLRGLNDKTFLAIFAYGEISIISHILSARGIPQANYSLATARPGQIPYILNAADLAVIFRQDNKYIQQIPSPIKFGEYLSCGLPIIMNSNIGDTEKIINKYLAGIVLDPDNPVELHNGAIQILDLCQNDSNIRLRCRQAAEKELNLDTAVDQYAQAYERVGKLAAMRKH